MPAEYDRCLSLIPPWLTCLYPFSYSLLQGLLENISRIVSEIKYQGNNPDIPVGRKLFLRFTNVWGFFNNKYIKSFLQLKLDIVFSHFKQSQLRICKNQKPYQIILTFPSCTCGILVILLLKSLFSAAHTRVEIIILCSL